MWVRGRACGDHRRAGDLRPAGAGAASDRLRRAVSVLADRGRVHALGRARLGRGSSAAAVIHALPLERRTLHGHFSRDLEAVLVVDPGDSVRFEVPNAGWELDRDELFVLRDPELDEGHALAGPIEVRGAGAGMTLVVHV